MSSAAKMLLFAAIGVGGRPRFAERGQQRPCGRRGRYDVGRFLAEHGDARLTDLLLTLGDCQKAHSASVHDRCKAAYGQRLP
jgi:hypothetical protein